MHDDVRIPRCPFPGPEAWLGRDLRQETSWIYILDAAEREEMERALDALRNRPLSAITAFDVPLPRVRVALASWRRELKSGRGFVLVRGVPVKGHSPEDIANLYWLLGLHMGAPVPQNTRGELLCDIRDKGADPRDPNVRLYATRAEQDFHTDAADIIALVCLQTAKSGGVSRIVSSVTVFNEFQKRRPDLVELLFEDWYFFLQGHELPGMPQYFKMPICRTDGLSLATFFLGWYIRRAQALDEVPKLSSRHEEALRLLEELANDPELYLDMQFQPGDIQWLKNSVTLHKRTDYEDWPEPERKRHLLRLWLTARDFEDGDERLRSGINARTTEKAP